MGILLGVIIAALGLGMLAPVGSGPGTATLVDLEARRDERQSAFPATLFVVFTLQKLGPML